MTYTLRTQLVEQLNSNVAHFQARLDKFADDVKGDNPRHALMRGTEQAIADAARIQVYAYYVYWIRQEKVSLVTVHQTLQERANHLGLCVPTSTSAVSNMLDNYERVAVLSLISDLKSYIKYDEVLDIPK